jgi:hypothetical protein
VKGFKVSPKIHKWEVLFENKEDREEYVQEIVKTKPTEKPSKEHAYQETHA